MEYKYEDIINENVCVISVKEEKYVKKAIPERALDIYGLLKGKENENVVKIYDIVKENNKNYVIEEYIEGVSLYDIKEKRRFSPEEIRFYAFSVCKGLEFLHSLGVIHRDISYNNVMVSKYGQVKIIDFDISHFEEKEKRKDTEVMGTAGFAAPEQFGFMRSDEKTDIYALGSLMNFMLENSAQTDKDLTAIAKKCMSFRPENRFKNVSLLRKALSQKEGHIGVFKVLRFSYYILAFLSILITVAVSFDIKGFAAAVSVFLCSVFPVMLFSNEFNWQDVFPDFKYAERKFKIFAEVIIYITALIISAVFIGLLKG